MTDLDDAFGYFRTLAVLVGDARKRAKDQPDTYPARLGISGLGKQVRKARLTELDDYFDDLDRTIFELFLLHLVATFERDAFARLQTAIGEARSTLDEHFPSRSPFARAAQHLVKDAKDDIYNLSGVQQLLKSYPGAATVDLAQLREHRNYVAHGGRVGTPSTFNKLADVHATLVRLLKLIKEVAQEDEALTRALDVDGDEQI